MDTDSKLKDDKSESGTVISVHNIDLEAGPNPENNNLDFHKNVDYPVFTNNLPSKDSGRSWLVCFSAFLIQVINVGVLHVFGVFFVAFLREFKSSKGETGET